MRKKKTVKTEPKKKRKVTFKLDSNNEVVDNLAQVQKRLHTTNHPNSLPGREKEIDLIYQKISNSILKKSPLCLCTKFNKN